MNDDKFARFVRSLIRDVQEHPAPALPAPPVHTGVLGKIEGAASDMADAVKTLTRRIGGA
jgi:hypothetical protein